MFSFVGDTVLDPFLGTGTTTRAAMLAGRNSIGVEVEPTYFDLSKRKLAQSPFGVSIDFLGDPAVQFNADALLPAAP